MILDSVKMITKNQSEMPKDISPGSVLKEQHEVEPISDGVVVSPEQIQKHSDDVDAIRLKLEKLGITEADIADAVKWARSNPAIDGA